MDEVRTPHPPRSLYTYWSWLGCSQCWEIHCTASVNNSLTLDAKGCTRNPEAPLSGVECHLQEVQKMGALGKQKVLVHPGGMSESLAVTHSVLMSRQAKRHNATRMQI